MSFIKKPNKPGKTAIPAATLPSSNSYYDQVQGYYNKQHLNSYGVPPPQPLGGVSASPLTINELYSRGWSTISESCPNCGAGSMLYHGLSMNYWCTGCSQKYTKEALFTLRRSNKVATALEWLDKQLAKYIGKK